jgi:hypothetical protein
MRTTSAGTHWGTWSATALALAGALLWSVEAGARTVQAAHQDLVAATVVDNGQAILLATPSRGLSGRRWRFRSFETSELPQPLAGPVLSASGTKLLVRGPGGVLVLDLTRQDRPNAARQYVDRRDPAIDGDPGRHTHRLPSQRFVVTRGSSVRVYDDVGAVLDSSVVTAVRTPPPASLAEANLRAYLQLKGVQLADDAIAEFLTTLNREAAASDAVGART